MTMYVPSIDVIVVVIEEPPEFKSRGSTPSQSSASVMKTPDLTLKDLRHPLWRRLRERICLLRGMCSFMSLFAMSVGAITVTIVGEADGVAQELLRIEDGSLSIWSILQISSSDLAIAIDLFDARPATLRIPAFSVTARLDLVHFETMIPISRTETDLRAPIPSSCSVTCTSIHFALQYRALIQASIRRLTASSLSQSHESGTLSGNTSGDLNLLVGAISCIPAVKLSFTRVVVDVADPDIEERSRVSLQNIDFQLAASDLSAVEADTEQYEAVIRPAYSEKAATLSVGTSELQLQRASDGLGDAPCHSIAKISRVKLSCFTSLEVLTDGDDEDDEDDCSDLPGMLSASVTITGECRGLSVTLSNRICPWIHVIFSELQRASWPDQRIIGPRSNTMASYIAVEVETQLKFVQTEIAVLTSNSTCDVLPRGVPSICLTADEVNLYGHPYVGEEQMGVRSKADLQITRLKMFFMGTGGLTRTLFLSLDFIRAFIAPLSIGNLKPTPAQVEVEAEWLELKWAPEVLHALAGVLELLIDLGGPIMLQKTTSKPNGNPTFSGGLKENVQLFVPPMRTIKEVMDDVGSSSAENQGDVEASILFRCTIKRVSAVFAHHYDNKDCIEYLTADTSRMSVEASTGRFRISVEQIKVFQVETAVRASCRGSEATTNLSFVAAFEGQSPPRRRSSVLRNKTGSPRNRTTSPRQRERLSWGQQTAKSYVQYFYAARFALEETKIRDGQSNVVDIFAEDAKLDWTMAAQLRVTEVVRKVTFASWEMLYRVRAAYALRCTPADSDYNRPFGLNPPLNDAEVCAQWEARLRGIISGSGNTLHRIHATGIRVHAPLTKTLIITADIGSFGGDDLPDLWKFGDIALKVNALEMLGADTVRIRRTVAKRSDYVFGVFEAMVRLRMQMTGRFDDGSIRYPDDGMLVECDGVRLQTSVGFQFRDQIAVISDHFEPYRSLLKAAMDKDWRPQHDLFYRYFLRTLPSSERTRIWLDMRNISLQCLGSDFEGWLEKVYPVWMQELEERELRAQVFGEHVASLKFTNPSLLSADKVVHELAAKLAEQNTRLYVQKIKKQRAASRNGMAADRGNFGPLSSCQTSLFDLVIGQLAGETVIGDTKTSVWHFIQQLDEAIESIEQKFSAAGRDLAAYEPSHLLLASASMDLEVSSITVHMRRFLTPIFHCDGIEIHGKVAMAAWSPGKISCTEGFELTGALRCFPDLQLLLKSPMICFCPGYVHALRELVARGKTLLPLLLLDVDKHFDIAPWDMARRLLHGKVSVVIENASLRLLSSTTSFELSDYLAVSLQQISVVYERSQIDIEFVQAIVKVEPWSLSHCMEVSSGKVTCWLNWSCLGGSTNHYVYPIEFCRTAGTVVDKFIVNLLDACSSSSADPIVHCGPDPSQTRSNPFKLYEATSLSVFIHGSVGRTADEKESNDDPTNATKTKREASALTAVILYMRHVEWLLRFGRLYYNFMQQLCHCHVARPVSLTRVHSTPDQSPVSILRVFSGVIVEKLDIHGLDVAIYKTEKHPVGIRAFISDRVSFSGALLHERHEFFSTAKSDASHSANQSEVRRLSLPGSLSKWIVHGVYDIARDIQVRVCSTESGSRGESLVLVKEVTFRAGGGNDGIPTHDGKLLVRDVGNSSATNRMEDAASETSLLQRKPGQLRREASKTILDHFEIAQHNPYHFRDSDMTAEADAADPRELAEGSDSASLEKLRRMGFLLGLFTREVRVLVTLNTLDTLVEIGGNWFEFVTIHYPEIFIPKPIERAVHDEQGQTVEEGSPKKPTSLAEDPKFGKIFDAYMKSNDDRHGSLGAMTTEQSIRVCQQEPQDAPATNTPPLVDAFFVVQFVDCQISIHDHAHKGSVLLALSRGTLKNSISADKSYEDIALDVEGVQMFTAPLDIDVQTRTLWLKAFTDGSYCPSSSGLFKRVIAPIPAMLTVWIERTPVLSSTASVSTPAISKIALKIPTVEVAVSNASKEILQHIAMGVMELMTTKFTAMKVLHQSDELALVVKGLVAAVTGSRDSSPQRTWERIQRIEAMRKQLLWKLALIEWQQMCRWSHYASDPLGSTANSDAVAFSPQLRRQRATAATSSDDSPRSSFSYSFAESLGNASGDASSSVIAAMITSEFIEEATDKSAQLADDLLHSQLQYSALSEALASLIKRERERCATQPNIEFEFSLKRAELLLSGETAEILHATASALQISTKQYEDRSGTFALTMRELTARNLLPGTKYPELLQLAYPRPGGSDELFLRVDAEQGRPVGGTAVVKHFEVNVHPIQVCVTQDIILQLITFFAPPAAAEATNEREEDHQRRRVRQQFLQPTGAHGSGSCGSPSERLMGGAASTIKRAVRVAGKAATYPRHLAARAGSSLIFREREESTGEELTRTERIPPNVLQALQEDAVGWVALLTGERDSGVLDQTAVSGVDANATKDGSEKLISFKRIRFGTLEVLVTYKNKRTGTSTQFLAATQRQQALEDMRGFALKIHPLVYCDKTCSAADLLLRVRRDIVLDVLSQVGRNFTNIGNFLRDQFDLSRWAPFDALAPLRSMAAVAPLQAPLPTSSELSAARVGKGATSKSDEDEGSGSGGSSASMADFTPSSASAMDRGFQLELPENHPALRKKTGGGGGFVRPSELLTRSPRAQSAATDIDSGASSAAKHKKSLSSLFSKKRAARDGG